LRAPAAPLRAGMTPVPVLEIGGTHVTAALVDLKIGGVVAGSVHRRELSPSAGAAEILGPVIACGRELPVPYARYWGVAIPGPFDYQTGVGLFAGVGKFEALYGADVRAALTEGLPGPPGSLTFLNDADAFGWGEWLFGAATGYDRCVAITLGTGIGSAFLADGEVRQSGAGVPPEGRVDLLRFSGQPLEEVVSARAIERAYRQRTGIAPRGTVHVARQARTGDQAAVEVLSTAFERLGTVLRPWLEDFGARVLVVGGSMTGSWDLIGPALLRGIEAGRAAAYADLHVSVAAHPEDAALLGTAAYTQRTMDEADRPPPGEPSGSDNARAIP
jgi:glucokinase